MTADDAGVRVIRAGGDGFAGKQGPHRPFDETDEPVRFVLARTDPNDQESVVPRPDLA